MSAENENVDPQEQGTNELAANPENAPIEPAAPTEGEKPAEPEKKSTETDDEFEVRRQKWQAKVDRRIAQITAKQYAEAERAEKAEKRAKELEALLEANTKKAELSVKEPKADDFESDAEYFKALGKWQFELGRAEERAQEATKQYEALKDKASPESGANTTQRTATTHPLEGAFEDGREKYEDFDDLVLKNNMNAIFTNVQLANYLTDVISDSEVAHEVLYELGKDAKLSQKLASMPPHKFAMEIGKLEAKIVSKPPPPPPKTTSAPPPIDPVSGGETSGTADPDPEKDPKAWIAARNAGTIK